MRVAFIVYEFPILSETFILNQITGLIDRGHEVDIYADQLGNTFKVHLDIKNYRLLERTFYFGNAELAMPANRFLRVVKGFGMVLAHCYKSPLSLLRSLNVFKYGKQAASLKLMYTVLPFLGKRPYDIVHCQFGTLDYASNLLRNIVNPKAKLITSFRGYDISQYVQEHGDHIYDQLFNTGDSFLTNCNYFKDRLIKLGCSPHKIVVHGSGIDCHRFRFTPRYLPSDSQIRIVTTGRLVEKKGIEYSICAIAKLVKADPNIEYLIIGDGPLQEDLQQLIQSLDVNNKVKLLGWKQQQEIIEILDDSHIFVAPSVTAKDGNQDAPINVLKEAMAMGLPVVSTRHGGIPELVENGVSGFLVPERDVDALAEKLAYLIKHSEDWPRFGRAGRAYVLEHYDTNQLNDQLVEIYQEQLNLKQ